MQGNIGYYELIIVLNLDFTIGQFERGNKKTLHNKGLLSAGLRGFRTVSFFYLPLVY